MKHVYEIEDIVFSEITNEEQEEANKVLKKIVNKLLEIGGCSNENI